MFISLSIRGVDAHLEELLAELSDEGEAARDAVLEAAEALRGL